MPRLVIQFKDRILVLFLSGSWKFCKLLIIILVLPVG